VRIGGRVRGPVEPRFWAKVQKTETCWLWTGNKNPKGYGIFYIGPTMKDFTPAHRFSYGLLVGSVPDGLQLDHLCRIRHCVNPAHLEPVTNRENILRGNGPTARHARQTECKHGHQFDKENTHQRPEGGRRCRTCMRNYNNARIQGGQV
jgi:hypothetical protein